MLIIVDNIFLTLIMLIIVDIIVLILILLFQNLIVSKKNYNFAS